MEFDDARKKKNMVLNKPVTPIPVIITVMANR